MMIIAAALALALTGTDQSAPPQAQPDPAVDAAPPATASAAEEGPDPNRQICRRRAATVGSNRSRRVCAPAWQWEEARQATRDELQRNSNGPTRGPDSGMGGATPPGRGF